MAEENGELKEPEVSMETSDTGPISASSSQENEVMKSENEILKKEISELKDQYLRKAADFENYRKRMQKEKEDSIKYANQNILSDLVNVVDDFERAIKSSEVGKDFENFHQGISMIEQQLVSTLERKYGLKRLDTLGTVFDPEQHEAISKVDGDSDEPLVVVEEFQKGFCLHDRVLRFAKVKVGPASGYKEDQKMNTIENEVNQKENK